VETAVDRLDVDSRVSNGARLIEKERSLSRLGGKRIRFVLVFAFDIKSPE